MVKKLISCVFPGFELVLAMSFLEVRALISELLPTLLRPMNANSGTVASFI